MKKITVLVVDDSSTMRSIIKSVLDNEPDIEVVGCVEDAIQAREAIKLLKPDVITLDIEMPGMNGLEFLSRLMRLRPTPTIMVSTLTDRGSKAAIEALSIGAIDYVIKPNVNYPNSLQELPGKVRIASETTNKLSAPAPVQKAPATYTPKECVIGVGSSTGGVEALQSIFCSMPANCPPIVVTQHMPPKFTRTLAERLDKICAPKIVEANSGMVLQVGHVYVAPGGDRHLQVNGNRLMLTEGDPVNGHRPSVDVMFKSLARSQGAKAIGVILTGMGNDGASGMLEMRKSGAVTIGQDEATSVVYGMPKAAKALGSVMTELSINQISRELIKMTSQGDIRVEKCQARNN